MRTEGKKRILIVDNDEKDCAALTLILKKNYQVDSVNNAEKAMEILLEPDCGVSAVVIDLNSMKEAGCSLLKSVLANETIKNIPTVVTTDSGDNTNKKLALRSGAWDVISKPYDEGITLFRVKNAIERSQLYLLEQLRYLVEYDALTGIYNKSRFVKKVKQAMAENPFLSFAVLHFDIDHFGMINSFFGRRRADKLLRFIAEQLKELSENYNEFFYARIEGDIFGICMSYQTKEDIEDLIHQMEERLVGYRLDFDIVTTFGIFLVEDSSISIDKMFYYAELAAWNAKSKYTDKYSYFEENMSFRVETEHEIINEMKGALSNQEFVLYLQPKYDLKTQKCAGAEALARWSHKDKGIISPSLFVPIFEKNGFISKLDYYMWEQTCILLRKWMDEGKQLLPISVNISRVNLYNSHLIEKICELTEKYGIPNELLQLELTESAYTDHQDTMKSFLHQLHDKGFTCLMDDFGSGYSSLNMLKDMPVDILKIDMKFFTESDIPGRSECIVESVVNMAKALNMTIVAEGVEKEEQVSFLQRLECDYVQGFFFGKPMRIEDFEEQCINNA